MAIPPSLRLAKLQELKQWQGSFENLLQQSQKKSPSSREKKEISSVEWDNKKVSPAKPFEHLVEDAPVKINTKQIRPFLRKGQGLARFKMAPTPTHVNKVNTENLEKKKGNTFLKVGQPKTPKGVLKQSMPSYYQEVDLSPLELPEFVKPQGTWRQVFEDSEKCNEKKDSFHKPTINSESDNESLENYDQFRKSLSPEDKQFEPPGNKIVANELLFKTSSNKQVAGESTNDLVKSHFIHQDFEVKSALICNDIPDNLTEIKNHKIIPQINDFTLEELRLEKELKLFEALEEKANNSSFCSTNASVMKLLASTPQKKKLVIDEAQEVNMVDDIMVSKYIPETIQMKLREVSAKTNILQQFLLKLYLLEKRLEETVSANTSFSNENTRWSSRSPSLRENYTEYETTEQSGSFGKIDIGVNTSFNYSKLDETLREARCEDCEKLRSKYSIRNEQCRQTEYDNVRLKSNLKELQKESEKLQKTIKKIEDDYEEKLEKLEMDLNNERMKFAKEKCYFETYVKEAQSRPTKKEREEITNLRQELADVKELVKLKDSKNGATQARLRTQIKQQEKELNELRSTVEKLQKENAKLIVSQKYARRPQEVKMLHKINKNLSKLTEETLKKQTNKSGNGNMEVEESFEEEMRSNINDICKIEKQRNKTIKDDQKLIPAKLNKDNYIPEKTLNDTPFNSLSIEQQYETTFENITNPKNVSCSTNLEKTERTLPDGSIEIVYSNGNLKTISADGNIKKMKYFNGDTKETSLSDKIIKYHYALADSWHVQYPDGTEVMEFKDGHKCTKHTDGRTEVVFPDGTLRIINADGTEEQRFPDGRKTVKNLQGDQIILLPNGQREIHTEEYKRREYPDGTIRTLHKDGTVETVYANGRVRLKDAKGVLIMDTHHS
ncbi:centromere protein J isoform X2 [Euwallacea fornicatus]|uniref:centromere protein J isoform X2 n=1 Tax=Euwallacea fornicatus TaxID=995702 RepID=UPI00338E6803